MYHITAGCNVVSQVLYLTQYYLNTSITTEIIVHALLNHDDAEKMELGKDESAELADGQEYRLDDIFSELILYERLLKANFDMVVSDNAAINQLMYRDVL